MGNEITKKYGNPCLFALVKYGATHAEALADDDITSNNM